MPFREPLYAQAKRLEYDGDIAGALNMFYRALAGGERVDSCLKDIAGLLNMMGRTTEAVEFLESNANQVTNKTGYDNLLARLKSELAKESSADLQRGITVTVVDSSLGPVTVSLCDRLFPNPSKIRRILHTDRNGFVGAVHFATHSSARKALQVHKLCESQVILSWSSLYTEARLQTIETMEIGSQAVNDVVFEKLPPHLTTFGGGNFVPIYREDDPSIPELSFEQLTTINEKARSRAETASQKRSLYSRESPKHTESPVSTEEGTPVALSPYAIPESTEMSAWPHEETSSLGGTYSSPFFTEVIHPNGRKGMALVVPLPDDNPPDENVTSAFSSFRTPIKPRPNRGCPIKTPTPIIERSLFT
jgi:hypothetical protein